MAREYIEAALRDAQVSIDIALQRAAENIRQEGKALSWSPNRRRKWMCTQCGGMGVSSTMPLCHEKGCDYKVTMVEISDLVYNRRVGDPKDIAARALINAGNAIGSEADRRWLMERADRIKAGTVLI